MTRLTLLIACIGSWALPSSAHAGFFGTDGVTCAHNTLQDAITAAPSGGTVYFQTGAVLLSPGAVINGKDLTLQGSDANCSFGTSGTASFTPTGSGSALTILWADVTIRDLNLSGGSTVNSGGIIDVQGATSHLNIFNTTLTVGSADGNGGCLRADAAGVWLNNSTIDGCAADGDGGAVALESGAYLFVDPNTTIQSGTAGGEGGILSLRQSTADVRGVLKEGHAGTYGGGVSARTDGGNPSTVTLRGTVEDCEAELSGGGVYLSGGDVELEMLETSVVRDSTAPTGGGVAAILGAVLDMNDDSSLVDNHATSHGGAVRVAAADVWMRDAATIEGNRADVGGGGLYVAEGASLNIDGTSRGSVRIRQNSAGEEGGGVYLWSATMDGHDLGLSSNDAGEAGGGLFVDSGVATLTNALINYNVAVTGGGVNVDGGSVVLESDYTTCDAASLGFYRACSEVQHNFAGGVGVLLGRGAGVNVRSSGSFEGVGLLFSDNAASHTGNDLRVTGSGSVATLRNALFGWSSPSSGTSIDVSHGALDLRSSTVAGHDVGVHIQSTATATMHRNIVADNTVGAILDGTATGNCNLSQALAESPTGSTNDVGAPNFATGGRSDYQLASVNPLAVDVCGAGPLTDIDGKPRPSGSAYDRGAYERP